MPVTVDISACCGTSSFEPCCCPCETPGCSHVLTDGCSSSPDITIDYTLEESCGGTIFAPVSFDVPIKACRRPSSPAKADPSGRITVRVINRSLRAITLDAASVLNGAPTTPPCALSIFTEITRDGSPAIGFLTWGVGGSWTAQTVGARTSCAQAYHDAVYCFYVTRSGTEHACCEEQANTVTITITGSMSLGLPPSSPDCHTCCIGTAIPDLKRLNGTAFPVGTTCGGGAFNAFLPYGSYTCSNILPCAPVGPPHRCCSDPLQCADTAPSTLTNGGSCGSQGCADGRCVAVLDSGSPYCCGTGAGYNACPDGTGILAVYTVTGTLSGCAGDIYGRCCE